MKWNVISASVRGSSHQRSGLPNQDAVDFATTSREDATPTVLAVADGHGGARYFRSQVGSTLAVHIAVSTVKEFLTNSSAALDLPYLCQNIVQTWLSAVRSDLENNPLTEEELATLEKADGPGSRQAVLDRPEFAYGATLLVAAVIRDRMIYLQLGDGDVLTVNNDGTTTRPIEADARLMANQTTSLCQPSAEREFRVALHEGAERLPVLVLLSTDGYVNSFRSEEDFLQIGRDYLELLREHGSESLAQELPGILTEATRQGSGDDITLGILHRSLLPRPLPAAAGKASTQRSSSQSVIIQKLKTEQHSQQKQLDELATRYEGARRKVIWLSLLVVLALAAGGAYATQSYWLPFLYGHKGKPVPAVSLPHRSAVRDSSLTPSNPGQEPPLPPVQNPAEGNDDGQADATPVATHLMLKLSNNHTVSLKDDKTLTAEEMGLGKKDAIYARIKSVDGRLKMSNLSQDLWLVTLANSPAQWQYAHDDSVPLEAGTKLVFRKSVSGVIEVQGK